MTDEKIQTESFHSIIKEIKSAFQYLLSKWLVILLVSIFCGLIGLTYELLRKPSYIATTTFVSETGGDDKLGGYASIAAQFGIGLGGIGGGGIFEGDNLMELFKSRVIIVNTLLQSYQKDTTNHIIDEYIKNHNYLKKLKSNKNFTQINFNNVDNTTNRLRDSIISTIYEKIVKDQLIVEKLDKKLDIITLNFEDINEDFAKIFSQKITENAINFYTTYKIKKAKKNVDILQHQADTLRDILDGSIYNLASTTDLNINPTKQVLRVEPQKKQITLQISSAIYTEILKQLEIAKLTLRKETPLIQIIDTPFSPLKKAGMGKLALIILSTFIGFLFIAIYYILKRKDVETISE